MSELAGFNTGLGNLWHLPKLQSRSISPENFSGEKGHAGMATDGMGAQAARDLGPGWKISPCVAIKPDEVITLADIDGPGVIQSMWITGSCAVKQGRLTILRIYWDGQDQPSVECPLGDFFATGWGSYAQVSSLPVAVTPSRGFNCFWPMPFRGHFDKTRYRLLMAKICLKAGRPDLARSIVEELYKAIEELHLERWESPVWIGEVLEALYQCLTAGPDTADATRAGELFQKLCITDVTKAMLYKQGST